MIERDGQMHCENGEFSHHGKFGDIIYALPTIRAFGKGKLYLYDEPEKSGMRMTEEAVAQIAPLLEQQPYIDRVEYSPRVVRSNLPGFRDWSSARRTLPGMHLATMGLSDSSVLKEPWLSVEPRQNARILFSFTERYRDGLQYFPWCALAQIFKNEAGFLGMPHEHALFTTHTGVHLPRLDTPDLLSVAESIAGADLLIANVSCPLAIGFALGTPCLVERPHYCNVDWDQPYTIWIGRNQVLQIDHLNMLLQQRAAGKWILQTVDSLGSQQLARPVVLRTVADKGWNQYNFDEIFVSDSLHLQELLPVFSGYPPRLIVDAGANMGFWAALAASLWPAAEIIAIEPNEATHAQFRANAPQARLVSAALHYGSSETTFSLPPSGNTALGKCGLGGQAVRAVTLTEVTNNRPIDLLKIDIEGGEWNVFEHMDLKPRIIVGEFHDRPEQMLREVLEAQGYRVSLFPNHFHAVLTH